MTSYLDPLGLVQLPPLMQRTSGARGIRIGLIDGPVETSHSDLATDRIEAIGGQASGPACTERESFLCAWNLRRRYFVRPPGLRRAIDLPGLHAAGAPDFPGIRREARRRAIGQPA